MGIDDLVDDVEKEKEEEEIEGILDKLGINDKEELEELERKMDRVQSGLIEYDRRLEKIEERLSILEGAVARLIQELPNNGNSTSEGEEKEARASTEDEKEEQTSNWGESDNGLDW